MTFNLKKIQETELGLLYLGFGFQNLVIWSENNASKKIGIG